MKDLTNYLDALLFNTYSIFDYLII